jgi:N-acetylmuramoyl-L-alanine amidase
MHKAIIIAGHGGNDPGARGIYYKDTQLWEADLTRLTRDGIAHALGVMMHDDPALKYRYIKDCDNLSLQGVINWLNNVVEKKENRIILDIHFNVFNKKATGTETFYPENALDIEKKLAGKISKTSSRIMGIANRGAKPESRSQHKRLAIMRPVGINVLWEVCFMDNQSDVERFFNSFSALCLNVAKDIIDTFKEIS